MVSGGRKPIELVTLSYIDRFGAYAVMGRPLNLDELREMSIAENIKLAFEDRERSGNYAKWAEENKAMSAILSSLDKEYGRS